MPGIDPEKYHVHTSRVAPSEVMWWMTRSDWPSPSTSPVIVPASSQPDGGRVPSPIVDGAVTVSSLGGGVLVVLGSAASVDGAAESDVLELSDATSSPSPPPHATARTARAERAKRWCTRVDRIFPIPPRWRIATPRGCLLPVGGHAAPCWWRVPNARSTRLNRRSQQ